METVLKFIVDYCNFNVLMLFIVAAGFLIFLDSKDFKTKNLQNEYKTSKIMGYIYIGLGVSLYIISKLARV